MDIEVGGEVKSKGNGEGNLMNQTIGCNCLEMLNKLSNLDKDLARDTIAKLLKNVMKGELASQSWPRKRQTSRLSKG